jgi:hypothetical protein
VTRVRDLPRPHTNPGHVTRRRATACLLAGAAIATGGCGESPATSLSAGRAARWHDTIAGIRTADRPRALAALARLSGYVDRDAQAGQLAPADAAALRAGIAQARRHLPPAVTAPATAVAVSTVTPPPPPVASTKTKTRTQTHTETQTSTPPPAAVAEPPAAPPANGKDDAQARKDDEQARKDAAKAQKESLKAQKEAAKRAQAKPKPEKVKPKGDQP